MDTVKEYVGYINPHWVAIVSTGMYTYLRHICIIGLCFEEENNPPFDPSYSSIIFVFSALCLIAEYRLWPRSLKEPPIQLLYIYEMLVASLTTNLVTRAIWIPMMHVIFCLTQESSRWVRVKTEIELFSLIEINPKLLWLNTTLGLSRYSLVTTFAYYLAKENAATHMAFCLSLLSFVWMLDATESLDTILDIWTK
ncbi:hypothetical protein M0802_012896 [Mischocyttarus mexicanus]|nr:hypothetical protein M0802_012896 [Mischocyttarus mexicanus]